MSSVEVLGPKPIEPAKDDTKNFTFVDHQAEGSHVFGTELRIPVSTKPVDLTNATSSTGSSDAPAREDHVHGVSNLSGVGGLVRSFPSKAARDAALPVSTTAEGTFCVTTDSGALWELNSRSGTKMWTPPWNTPWGNLSYVTSVQSNGYTTTAADINNLNITFNAIGNRLYLVEYDVEVVRLTTAGSVFIQLTNSANAVLGVHGGTMVVYLSPNVTGFVRGRSFSSFTAGSMLVKARCSTDTGGTANVNGNRGYLAVTDVGPTPQIVVP